MKTQKEKWDEYLQAIIDALGADGIQKKCEEWGLEFTGTESGSGWAECRAKNRSDENASAAVNLGTGYYRDLGPGPSFPFFRLGVEYGPFAHFHECVDSLGKEVKVLSLKPKSTKGSSFWSKIKFQKWNYIAARPLAKKLGVSQETLKLVGACMAKTNSGELAVCFPIVDASLGFNTEQKGWVLMNSNGREITRYRGKGAPAEMLGKMSIGTKGIMNHHAITHWQQSQVIYKVEGVSDMLALQELIPEEHRGRHLVVTNSDGCDGGTAHAFGDFARGRQIVILHDADEPGQFGESGSKTGGAQKWVASCLSGGAKSVQNVQLPYAIEMKKGKDLRDWIEEGHTYDQFMDLVKATPAEKRGTITQEPIVTHEGLSEHQVILRELDLIVLGHTKNGSIQVFNAAQCRKFTISDIDRFSYNKQLIHIGQQAVLKIADPSDKDADEDMIYHVDVQVAISREAGGKELSRMNTIGVGMWESGGRMFAVGAGEWLAVNGGVQAYTSPLIDDKIVDFGETEEGWYDKDLLFNYLESAKSPEWRENHLMELTEIFGRWENHTHPDAGMILACLAIGTWAQSIWDWRPWIAIQGESSTGKTALMEFIANYFDKLAFATCDASAAGIRDEIGSSGLILMYDEFEGSKYRDEIIARLMSSSRRSRFGVTVRSSSSLQSTKSELQLIPWFSATDMKRDKQTESNRYITFELGNRDGLPFFDIPNDPDRLSELRNKSIATIMRCWARVKELCPTIIKSMDQSYSRQAESYALPCAIYAAICGDSDARAVKHHATLMGKLREGSVVEEEESEQKMLMNSILESIVQLGSGAQTTIGTVLATEGSHGLNGHDSGKILQTYGIRRIPFSEVQSMRDWKDCPFRRDESYVFLASGNQLKRTLLKGTDHVRQDLKTILKRLPGAFSGLCRVGNPTRGTFIPSSNIGNVNDTKVEPFATVEIDGDLDSM